MGRFPSSWTSLLITLYKIFWHFRSKFSVAVIAHNTEQQGGFGSALSFEQSHITHGG